MNYAGYAKAYPFSFALAPSRGRLQAGQQTKGGCIMSSVCDDCKRKCICKPSKPYHFACQWKPKKEKADNVFREDWGIPVLPPVPKE